MHMFITLDYYFNINLTKLQTFFTSFTFSEFGNTGDWHSIQRVKEIYLEMFYFS